MIFKNLIIFKWEGGKYFFIVSFYIHYVKQLSLILHLTRLKGKWILVILSDYFWAQHCNEKWKTWIFILNFSFFYLLKIWQWSGCMECSIGGKEPNPYQNYFKFFIFFISINKKKISSLLIGRSHQHFKFHQ